MSTENTIDYEAVLVDLRQRRDVLDSAINAIESVLGVVKTVSTSQVDLVLYLARRNIADELRERERLFGSLECFLCHVYRITLRPRASFSN